MNFSQEASKIVTNKYFLYLMVFLSVANVIGYLVNNKLNAIVFFGLIGFLSYQFSKNMAVVLLIALVATNFLMSTKIGREGLENQDATSLQNAVATDPQIADAVTAVKKAKKNEDIKTGEIDDSVPDSITDMNNPELNTSTASGSDPEGFGEKLSNNKKGGLSQQKGSRLDYAATIEESYKNLDSLLGSDSIQQLTKDTQHLMAKQQKLFETMNTMVPVLEGAQNMLKNFNIDSITDSLKHLGPLDKQKQ